MKRLPKLVSTNKNKINNEILHVVTVSFVINHFFGNQFNYLRSKNGKNYHLACSSSKELHELSNTLKFIPFEVEITRSINPLKDLKAIISIYKYIKKNNISTVIGHTPKGGLVAMTAAFLARTEERIYFRHGIIYETSTGFKRFLMKNIDRLTGFFAKKVVCVSNSVKQISERDRLNKASKNIVLGMGTCNGINTSTKFNPDYKNKNQLDELRSKYNIRKDNVVGYIGRLVKDKGIDELILAWEIVNSKFPDSQLLLVGPIEERDSISSYSKKVIAENQSIIFIDFVIDASPFFSLMNIFVLPTYREGFPTVALEASSMELPVLITKATGCTEAIIDNKTGIYITYDVNDIAKKIIYYMENEEIALEHGRQGRIFVNGNFEETKVWDLISAELKI